LESAGLETRRWNGTKSAFADCTSAFVYEAAYSEDSVYQPRANAFLSAAVARA
jgi:hypothetical protein